MLGIRLKEKRLERGFSIRGVAQASKIAHSMISDIENGRVIAHVRTLADLYGQLGVELLIDPYIVTELKSRMDDFYEALFQLDDNQIHHIFADITKEADRFAHSVLAIDYEVLQAVYRVAVENGPLPETLERLTKHYRHLNPALKQHYNLLNGYECLRRHDYESAVKFYTRNLAIQGEHKLHAVSMAYLAEAHSRNHQPHKMIHYGTMASKALASHTMRKRKLALDRLLARNLIDVGHFDDAETVLRHLELSARRDDIVTADELAYLHAYLRYRLGETGEALDILNTVTETMPYYHFFKALLYDLSERKDEAETLLAKKIAESDGNDDVDTMICRLFLMRLRHENSENFEKTLKMLIDRRQEIPIREILRTVILWGVEHYEAREMSREGLTLAKFYIQELSE